MKKRDCFTSLRRLILVPVSEWLGALVKQSFLGSCPMSVISNGVDLDLFTPTKDINLFKKKYSLQGKCVLLGVANVWNEKKGFYDFIELSKNLPEQFKIVMIGLSAKQINELPSTIIGLNRTTSQMELAQWYSLSDIVLNLSYEETFGMTTVEGLACGTPSIVYDRTASPELADEETCLVAKAGDIEDIIKKAIIIGQKTEIISYACRERAEEKFDKNMCFEKYIKLYESLLNN